jgi:diguanylate cyclase (GGDEF)-like protein
LLALLVCIATTVAQTIAATGVPLSWRTVGVVLELGLAAGSILGHRRGHFGPLSGLLAAGALAAIGVAMGDPFRATELIYVGLFHQSLFRSWRSTATTTAALMLALVASITLSTYLVPSFRWDLFEVVLQIPAVLLVGVIHILGVTIGRHERAAIRERALAVTGSDLVAASSRAEVYAAAIAGAQALVAPHARAAVTLGVGPVNQMRIVASTGDRGHNLSDRFVDLTRVPAISVLLTEARPGEINAEVVNQLRRVLGESERRPEATLFVSPLTVQGDLRGVLAVITASSLPEECKAGLTTLGWEVALALETIDLNDRLRHQAFHDPLTNLGNRTLLAEHARAALESTTGTDRHTALLLLDLDSFKMINDTLGHAAGDRMLVEVAERLTHCLPEQHCAARLGGDEFAVLLRDLERPHEEAFAIAECLLLALRQPLPLDGKGIVPEASIGVAVGTAGASIETLLRDADLAMYAAKRAGKGRYVMFEAGLREAALQRLELDVELRHALENNQFELHYQPIVRLGTGDLIGLEALIRWRHPRRGLLAAGEFIPHAEQSGLIVPIGQWVLWEACRQARAWQLRSPSLAPVRVGVNVAPRQLQQLDLEQLVREALHDTGLAPERLTLEFTESGLVERTDEMIEQLRAVKALGVHLALDDFGTGYSSLAYLRHYPFDAVKIDRSFLRAIDTDPHQAAFVSAIVTLAHTLGMRAVGEGVESAAQGAQLRALGCDFGQGFHYGRPIPASAVDAWLDDLAQIAA